MEAEILEQLTFITNTMRFRFYLVVGFVILLAIIWIVDVYIIHPLQMKRYWKEKARKEEERQKKLAEWDKRKREIYQEKFGDR